MLGNISWGGVKFLYVDVPAMHDVKSLILLHLFLSPFTIHQCTNFVKKHQILRLVFIIICSKYTRFGHLHLDEENPFNNATKIVKKHPKRQACVHIQCQCEIPPSEHISLFQPLYDIQINILSVINVFCQQPWVLK